MNLSPIIQLHTTVFSQAYSPCGKYLAVCTHFGRIALFSLPDALSPDAGDYSWKSIYSFPAHLGPIYSLASTDRFLISAGTGDILIWSWADILNKAAKVISSLPIPIGNSIEKPETNTVIVKEKGFSLNTPVVSGGGDDVLRIWDLETSSCQRELVGHKDYIHCATFRNGGHEILSGSEDGSVRLWDTRVPGEATLVIEPYKNEICCRPRFGKWIGSVAVDSGDDWMVCGGGPSLSLWHMRSITMATTFPAANCCFLTALFHEDSIISAGSEPYVYHWNINGTLKVQVPTTPSSIYSVNINNSTNYRVLAACGSSHKIDICTNFAYKAFSLTF